MVEGTSGIDFLFGIILAVVVANWVAGQLPGYKEGAYAAELEREGGISFLRPEAPHALQHLSARDVSPSVSPPGHVHGVLQHYEVQMYYQSTG